MICDKSPLHGTCFLVPFDKGVKICSLPFPQLLFLCGDLSLCVYFQLVLETCKIALDTVTLLLSQYRHSHTICSLEILHRLALLVLNFLPHKINYFV